MLNEFLFTKIQEEDIGNIYFQQNGTSCHTAEATLEVWAMFLKIALSAAEQMLLRYLLAAIWHRWTILCGGAVKGKCYADKPDTIEALKDNIPEAIDEIQLRTIDNVLKNWTDRVGCCMTSRGSR